MKFRPVRAAMLGGSVVVAQLLFSAVPAGATFNAPAYLTEWGSPGSGSGQFNSPEQGAFAPNGDLYIADTSNNRVQEFNPNGTYVRQWGSVGTSAGQFLSPRGLAIDGSGNVYVSDYGNSRIQEFTSSGTYVTVFGGSGAGDGQLNGPEGLAFAPSGNLFVADYGNNRVQEFTPSGTFVSKFGVFGSGDGQLDGPIAIGFASGGNAYVADFFNHRVEEFTSAGAYVAQAGGWAGYPLQVTVGPTGEVNVAVGSQIQVLSSALVVVGSWGTAGSAPGELGQPNGIAFDTAGSEYVIDANNNRVAIFGTPSADLVVSAKGPKSVKIGTSFSDTFTVHNAGPNDTPSANLAVKVPSGLTFLSSPGCVKSKGGATCTISAMSNGSDVPVKVKLKAKGAGRKIVTGTATSSISQDPNAGNSHASATTSVK